MVGTDLDGQQIKAFSEALVSAFPDHGSLARMVRFTFNIPLPSVAAPSNLVQVAFEVIVWAVSRGQLGELLDGALRIDAAPDRLITFAAADSTPQESIRTVTLAEAQEDMADMHTLVIVGSSTTRRVGPWVYTPRGV